MKIIIREFNDKLSTWGSSDTWTSSQFKVLEDLIYEKSKISIHANTLKRFFQEHTPNPQLSTRNALCVFLGYAGYNDFVMKKADELRKSSSEGDVKHETAPADASATPAKSESAPIPASSSFTPDDNVIEPSPRKRRWLIISIVTLLVVAICGLVWRYVSGTENTVVNPEDVTLVLSANKGASPLTVSMEYAIPAAIVGEAIIEVREANGDVLNIPLTATSGTTYATFVYPGLGHIRVLHNGEVLKELDVESRRRGWQAFVSEGYSNAVINLPLDFGADNGVLSLPQESIPSGSLTDKLFVSYSYYAPDLVDGDNFTVEARVRNSDEDGGIPCYDAMLYIFAGKKMHGFALNEEGYAYCKFVSGDKSFTGDRHDFSFIKYSSNEWHTMRITVHDKHTVFMLDGNKLFETEYAEPLGMVDELTLRFKGCGAVDYVKIYDDSMNIVFEEDF